MVIKILTGIQKNLLYYDFLEKGLLVWKVIILVKNALELQQKYETIDKYNIYSLYSMFRSKCMGNFLAYKKDFKTKKVQ